MANNGNKFTLKQKYNYYKNKATNPNAKNSQGKPMSFLGRVACANKANSIKRKMGRNKNKYDFIISTL